ncbi:HCNGP-like protein-domain-containing protein [Talaromyces proteolyticus]|uniref:HCNGP-like protein-domain-containing protein n=1 Tax=Talaromyces proteolyticus TaxID=1131652 RepID=A0AAD4KKB6_9EURO|nr:HCNGP-like protein-domain-containing protein [Talaromyces proteolyticus]KAH8693523.1 HCNGP-like protein-domain-containing protein [Talaromyces proteolyticus]
MLGLGGYGSSDEDQVSTAALKNNRKKLHEGEASHAKHDVNSRDNQSEQIKAQPIIETGPVNGPMLGPNQPQEEVAVSSEGDLKANQSSLYTTPQALIQDLTLPPVPNLEIPLSPPGSPNPTVKDKTSHFLSLKKQGVHFNEKLAASSSLKNPMLLSKLRAHNNIDDYSQYASVLPHDMWNPKAFPDWAYKEELWKMQQAVRSKIEESKQSGKTRHSLEFVPSSAGNE